MALGGGKGIAWNEESWQKMQAKLHYLAQNYPTECSRAAASVAVQVINDSIFEEPTVPIDTGNLRSSGTYEVITTDSWRAVSILVGFNAPYALKVHEVPMNFKEPGSGNKYLSSKLQRHADEYIRVWVTKVDRALGFR